MREKWHVKKAIIFWTLCPAQVYQLSPKNSFIPDCLKIQSIIKLTMIFIHIFINFNVPYFDIDRANARTSIRVRTTTPPKMLVIMIICFLNSSMPCSLSWNIFKKAIIRIVMKKVLLSYLCQKLLNSWLYHTIES